MKNNQTWKQIRKQERELLETKDDEIGLQESRYYQEKDPGLKIMIFIIMEEIKEKIRNLPKKMETTEDNYKL